MAEDNNTGSNAVWAIALVVVVAIIAGVVYYSGIMKTSSKKEVDIKVTTPAAPPASNAAPAR
jgi:cell division protein FtsN